jgi:structure-specific endonuclease subunit SLX1
LVSELAGHANKVYVGTTNNMQRRLRQHNGDLKAGGAKYTHLYRPWRIAATVRHFRSYTEAQQFEWAWQHPGRTRHLKEHRNARLINGSRTLQNYLCTVAFLTQSKYWKLRNLVLFVHHIPQHLRQKFDEAVQDDSCVREEAIMLDTVNV